MRTPTMFTLALYAGVVWAAEPGPRAAQGGKPQPAKGGAPTRAAVLVEKLGNPLARRYPDGGTYHHARTVSGLRAFDGKLYVGHGDMVLNSGPTDVWYYDLRK